MDKKLFRNLIFLITYAVLLVMVLVNRHDVAGLVSNVLNVLQPLTIGFALAFILNRPCAFFARHYERALPQKAKSAARPLALVTSYLVLLGLIALLVSFVIPGLGDSIRTFAGQLSTYIANLQSLYDWVVTQFDLEFLENIDLSGLTTTLRSVFNSALNAMSSAVPQLVSATATLVSGIVTLFLSVVFSIYLLAGAPRLLAQCRRLLVTYLPEKFSAPILHVVRLSATTFTNFIIGQVTEACILGCLCFLGMTIFRFDYALLISVIIAVSALIPIAGAYVGAIVACLLLVMIDPMEAMWFLIFLVILQQLEGNIIYPRVVGTSLGLPALWVLAAVTVGGGLFGFAGMLLGVPVTAVLYTLLRDDVRKRCARKEQHPAE